MLLAEPGAELHDMEQLGSERPVLEQPVSELPVSELPVLEQQMLEQPGPGLRSCVLVNKTLVNNPMELELWLWSDSELPAC